jgi:putative DNA primase/helicase
MLTERLASTERFSRVGGRASYPVADLVSAMVSAGAEFRVPPVADGKVRRTATVTHPAKKNFTYVLYPDGLAGWFENHETGDGPRRIYLVGKETEIATDQREKWEAARMKRETLAEKKRIAARILAQEICGRARPADPWHAYLAKKKIRPFKLLQVEADLIAPIVSVEGEVQTLERIRPDGTKGFLPGGRVSGNFYALGDVWNTRRLLVCEGVATSHCLFEATGLPTLAAMFAGNLEAVGRVILKVMGKRKVLVCADDDWQTKGNPGLTAATRLAELVEGRVTLPVFSGCDRGPKATDFNDLQIIRGLDEVRRQVIWAL